jgi:hypothetical protein
MRRKSKNRGNTARTVTGETLARKLKMELDVLADEEKRKYAFLRSISYDEKLAERYKNQREVVDPLVSKVKQLINSILRQE